MISLSLVLIFSVMTKMPMKFMKKWKPGKWKSKWKKIGLGNGEVLLHSNSNKKPEHQAIV